ncbi:MAG: hypothetical protein P8186_29995 [Anaerolineae bacterium]
MNQKPSDPSSSQPARRSAPNGVRSRDGQPPAPPGPSRSRRPGRGAAGTGSPQPPRLVVVGPDAAGKSELVGRLRGLGYNAGSCAQEHSYVRDMWRRLARPDFLIYLDARLETIARRRVIDWGQERLDELNARLAHAREHCDLYLPTDDLEAPEVVERVCAALAAAGIVPAGDIDPAADEEAAGDDEA